ncbi:saccharopine dehydrogenase NADP-binding domain-containing protein [Acidiferrimicrobium sp. IK]|uniref:saccharopine dehydrogenase family protein n=1 Tax=Acidiferrimicrobium sp. IK TaxID=2871700 RepID=UPI0021CB06ED|nr:saccharopine dehydrogenase NADP-binding domain-containing protein [Acidiferrimicrobium sp. IK]MCU4185968.1 saccharopine dehydrogenase NADP-binding domain-containing protein [Acidiferrimicrobium sp. IK]
MTDRRDNDVVLYGATGFVGTLTARYLAAHAPAGTRIALAGRSQARLEAVRDGLGAPAAGWPLLVADSSDRAALADMASRTAVVATTVGPYARYGMALAEACAQHGTHYADLTGEVLFVRDCIDRFHDRAADSGARMVTSCGYDSIPSDIGVMLVHARAAEDGAGGLTDTVLKATAKGGFSGGTIDSMRAQMEAIAADRRRAKIVNDPYALSPDRAGEPDLGPQPDAFAPRRDALLGEWSAPFVMASYNTRIVRRSNALAGWAYGRGLKYREVMAFGAAPLGALAAGAVTGGLAGAVAGMRFAPTRALLDRVLPKPGEGPSQKVMDSGRFRSDIVAVTEGGGRYRGVVAADGDPGYKATAVMLGESALALALDGDRLPERAGVLTPATGIGMPLVERLRAAGFLLTAGPDAG